MEIQLCKKCGFILNTRPGLGDTDGVCSACINYEKKKDIDFSARQKWLTQYIKDNKTNPDYDCLVAVSGGKDSTVIVRKLFEEHEVRKILLVNITDEFTKTRAGIQNLNNIVEQYNCDLITFRLNPTKLRTRMLEDLENSLNPLKWLEQELYRIPIEIAKRFNIKIAFFGENSDFEYGSAEDLYIYHKDSDEETKVIFMGAIHSYEASHWCELAKEVGFIDLNYYNEWQRQGVLENYSQIDSIGYLMGIWTKFVKFGFARVSDMASRFVRAGLMTYKQAQLLISENDYICDPTSMRDMCRFLNISEEYFKELVDKHANTELVVKDINGVWRRKDYYNNGGGM